MLRICSIRNIEYAELCLGPKLNLIYGENGSGKTSILEAINLLAMGRSFRSSKTGTVTSEGKQELSIYAETQTGNRVGLVKPRRQSYKLRLDAENQKNWDRVARRLPIQVLDSSSFLLLEGGPKARRRFLDWGVFHVEHGFLNEWRKSRKCIANRNLLLKEKSPDESQLRAWDSKLCEAAQAVDDARKRYFQQFIPAFKKVYSSLVGQDGLAVNLKYHRGWDSALELTDLLIAGRQQDLKYGSTQNGPHRADIVVKAGSVPAIDLLSRGQQKVLVSALKITQGMLFASAIGEQCIYLVDDLPAELDRDNRAKILDMLISLDGQLFVTCVERSSVESCLQCPPEMTTFHVERGTITD